MKVSETESYPQKGEGKCGEPNSLQQEMYVLPLAAKSKRKAVRASRTLSRSHQRSSTDTRAAGNRRGLNRTQSPFLPRVPKDALPLRPPDSPNPQ